MAITREVTACHLCLYFLLTVNFFLKVTSVLTGSFLLIAITRASPTVATT